MKNRKAVPDFPLLYIKNLYSYTSEEKLILILLPAVLLSPTLIFIYKLLNCK